MKTTKAELEQIVAEMRADLDQTKAELADAKKAKPQAGRFGPPAEGKVVTFPKRDGAHPKAPDYQGQFTIDGKLHKIALWHNEKRTVLKGNVEDALAAEIEREEKRDPSTIPSIDNNK